MATAQKGWGISPWGEDWGNIDELTVDSIVAVELSPVTVEAKLPVWIDAADVVLKVTVDSIQEGLSLTGGLE